MALYVASGQDYLCGRCGNIIEPGVSLLGDENVGVLGYNPDRIIVHECGDTTGLALPPPPMTAAEHLAADEAAGITP